MSCVSFDRGLRFCFFFRRYKYSDTSDRARDVYFEVTFVANCRGSYNRHRHHQAPISDTKIWELRCTRRSTDHFPLRKYVRHRRTLTFLKLTYNRCQSYCASIYVAPNHLVPFDAQSISSKVA